MEIEFNPSRVSRAKPGYSEPSSPRGVPTAGVQGEPIPAVVDLQGKLNDLAAVRPGKVAQAKALLADEKYPPNYLLDRIAVLLAVQIKG